MPAITNGEVSLSPGCTKARPHERRNDKALTRTKSATRETPVMASAAENSTDTADEGKKYLDDEEDT